LYRKDEEYNDTHICAGQRLWHTLDMDCLDVIGGLAGALADRWIQGERGLSWTRQSSPIKGYSVTLQHCFRTITA